MLYTSKRFTAESRPGIPLQTSIPFLISGRRTRPFHSTTMGDLATKFSGKLVIFSVSFDPHLFLPD